MSSKNVLTSYNIDFDFTISVDTCFEILPRTLEALLRNKLILNLKQKESKKLIWETDLRTFDGEIFLKIQETFY